MIPEKLEKYVASVIDVCIQHEEKIKESMRNPDNFDDLIDLTPSPNTRYLI